MPFLIGIKIVLLSTIFGVKKTKNNILIENTVKNAKPKERFVFITLFTLPIFPIWYKGPIFTDSLGLYSYKRDSYWYEGIIYLLLARGFSFFILAIFNGLLYIFSGTTIDQYKICKLGKC